MKKTFLYINFALMALLLVFDLIYMFVGGLALKTITSCVFVAMGVVNLIFAIKEGKPFKFLIILASALFVAMLGDVIINIHFMAGAIIFAIGHVIYFVSYMQLNKFELSNLVYIVAIAVPSMLIVLFAPGLDYGGSVMKIVCCIYALIISFMVGKSLANFLKEKTITNLFILIGSCLFFVSDLMLLLDVFGSIPATGYLCLATYYPGQALIAFGGYMYVISNKKQNEGGEK